MSGSKLLEQAIVDAQALRDSAFKSAQAALVEKFAPQIKEAVEKLLEQGPEEDPAGMAGSPEDAMAADIPGGTDFGGAAPDTSDKSFVAGKAKDIPLAATDGEKLCPCPDDEEEIELNLDLSKLSDDLKIGKEAEEEEDINMQPMLGGMQNQPPAAGGTGLTESMELEEVELEEDGEPGANIHDESMQRVDLEEEELAEVNMDEVLATEAEQMSLPGMEKKEPTRVGVKLTPKEEPKYPPPRPGESSSNYASRTGIYPDDDEGTFLEEKEELTPAQKTIAQAAEPKDRITGADFAALRAKKSKNESKEVEQTKQLIKASSALLKEVENKDAKINKLLEENKKSSSIIEEMSQAFKKLEEVNVLNAKLFYENQVLKSPSLNERQKINIVEAISKADSVSEAKTVYETLINSVGGQADKERSPKSLNEAISKKSSFRLPHKQTEQPNDSNKDRWLKLAGIK